MLLYDSSSFFIKIYFKEFKFNIFDLSLQKTNFGSRLHMIGNDSDAKETNKFYIISTPAHLSKFQLNQNPVSGTVYDDSEYSTAAVKTTTVTLQGGYKYVACGIFTLD